jgi:hypothetical protein
MPRVRLTARGCSAVAVLAAVVFATAASAAPPAPARKGAPPSAAAGARPVEIESRKRDEVDAIQRQDVADALKRHFNIDVDWRTTPLDRLVDIRVRAAKAAELQQRLGVSVDWQRYSWIELEALRRTLLSFERYRGDHPEAPGAAVANAPVPGPPAAADELVPPTFKAQPAGRPGRSTDPDGIIRPTFTGRPEAPAAARDPDGVIRPTFAARPRWSTAHVDPDGLITPTFMPFRRTAAMGDADDLIDPIRDPGRVPNLPR